MREWKAARSLSAHGREGKKPGSGAVIRVIRAFRCLMHERWASSTAWGSTWEKLK